MRSKKHKRFNLAVSVRKLYHEYICNVQVLVLPIQRHFETMELLYYTVLECTVVTCFSWYNIPTVNLLLLVSIYKLFLSTVSYHL